MNPIKQALIFLIQIWKKNLIVGVITSTLIFVSGYLGSYSILFVAPLLLFIQQSYNRVLESQDSLVKIAFIKRNLISIIIVGLAFSPTGILLGSAFGLLESPEDRFSNVLRAEWLLLVCCLIYLVVNHGLTLHFHGKTGLARSLDIAIQSGFKKIVSYVISSFYMSISLLIAGFFYGYGMMVSLPFVFLVCYFHYIEMSKTKAFHVKEKAV
jgi:hypothetical protein